MLREMGKRGKPVQPVESVNEDKEEVDASFSFEDKDEHT